MKSSVDLLDLSFDACVIHVHVEINNKISLFDEKKLGVKRPLNPCLV